MNSEDKSRLIENLKVDLHQDLIFHFNSAIDFLYEHGTGDDLVKAVNISAKMHDSISAGKDIAISEEEIYGFRRQLILLLDNVALESHKLQFEEKEQLITHYISKKSRDVVFEGNFISKRYREFSLDPISLQLQLGEITGVVGENGHGKSTLIKIIAGEISTDSGWMRYPIFQPNKIAWDKARSNIGYVPQKLAPWPRYPTLKSILHFTAAAKGIMPEENIRVVDYLISRLGLKKHEDSTWPKLSGGYQLRFELARQMLWMPKLLILDEPLANLDVKAQERFLVDLRNLADSIKSPMAVLLTSQNIFDVESVSDNIIFLRNGTARYNGRVELISSRLQTNAFIFSVSQYLTQLYRSLTKYSSLIVSLKEYNSNYILVSKKDFLASDLLNLFLSEEIKVTHFRDISNSTRRFFEEDDI